MIIQIFVLSFLIGLLRPILETVQQILEELYED